MSPMIMKSDAPTIAPDSRRFMIVFML